MLKPIRLACLLAAALAPTLHAQQVLPLWPHGTPEPAQSSVAEHDVTTDKDALFNGERSRRMTDVTKPTMTVFAPAASAANTGAAAVVLPGGAYSRLALDGEGTATCKWLNRIGVTCLLVEYRVPFKEHYPQNFAQLEDAQQAMRLARRHAAEWHLDAHKIGVAGYSAGAHLAVTLSSHFDDPHVLSTPAAPDVDANLSARPDFALVIYPAYLTTPDLKTLLPELAPTATTPPTFLLQAEDDSVHVESSLRYYQALKDAKTPAELHLYPSGKHGFGVDPRDKVEAHWTDLATAWLRNLEMIP